MNAIWKFPLTAEETEIEAPIEHFLTVQMQGDTPCVWAIVNLDRPKRQYKISILGTGWECPRIDAAKYIGTFQENGYVWHCFWEQIPARISTQQPTFTMFSKLT